MARIRSPLALADESVFRTTTPHPSPRTYPSALASNVLQRPSGASIRDLEKLMFASGERIRFTPAARARLHSPARKLRQAWCTATSDAEQAVSIAIAGPCSPKK